jgi:regulator of replication initiation timing
MKEAKGQELQAERAKRKKLNGENPVLRQKIAELVSKNAALEAELDHLRVIVENENVNLLNLKHQK